MLSGDLLASLIFVAILLALPTVIECPRLLDLLKKRSRPGQYRLVSGAAGGASYLFPLEQQIVERRTIPKCDAPRINETEMLDLGPDQLIEGIYMDKDGEWFPWTKKGPYAEVTPVHPEKFRKSAITLNLGPCTIYLELEDGRGQVKLIFPNLWSMPGLSTDAKEDPTNIFICVGAIFESEDGFRDFSIHLESYAFKNNLVGYINTGVFRDMSEPPKSKTNEIGHDIYYLLEKFPLEKVIDPSNTKYPSNDLLAVLTVDRTSGNQKVILTIGPCSDKFKYIPISRDLGRLYATIIVK